MRRSVRSLLRMRSTFFASEVPISASPMIPSGAGPSSPDPMRMRARRMAASSQAPGFSNRSSCAASPASDLRATLTVKVPLASTRTYGHDASLRSRSRLKAMSSK